MTATLLVGDVHERQAELIARGEQFDLIITSPPFLALRSYLPDDHPDKALEIGSEGTPAAYLDVLLALTAEWRKLLASHGSIAVELGDTYAGSGGAGGDYNPDGLRDGQERFSGSAKHQRAEGRTEWERDHPIQLPRDHVIPTKGNGWPLEKSLCGIPTLYAWSLAYGRNLLTGAESPAGQWRIRNLKPWIRTNPPVGALGDKERPATSYITVATLARDRWFDLDAVRTAGGLGHGGVYFGGQHGGRLGGGDGAPDAKRYTDEHPAGAPPLDWWHQTDAVIDDELQQRAGIATGVTPRDGDPKQMAARDAGVTRGAMAERTYHTGSVGARGWHIRRRLEKAGILPTHPDALDISPRGYSGAHYAVWPPELVRQLVDEMCPRKVCTECGEPSVRLGQARFGLQPELATHIREQREAKGLTVKTVAAWFPSRTGGITGCVSNWETTRVPTAKEWPILKERLDLSDDFDDFVMSRDPSIVKYTANGQFLKSEDRERGGYGRGGQAHPNQVHADRHIVTQWSDCGHNTWRPGRILDPFSGSGTTLAVATGMGRDAVGIDLDPRNAHLTEQRVGMFLTVDWGDLEPTDELPPADIVAQVSGDLL